MILCSIDMKKRIWLVLLILSMIGFVLYKNFGSIRYEIRKNLPSGVETDDIVETLDRKLKNGEFDQEYSELMHQNNEMYRTTKTASLEDDWSRRVLTNERNVYLRDKDLDPFAFFEVSGTPTPDVIYIGCQLTDILVTDQKEDLDVGSNEFGVGAYFLQENGELDEQLTYVQLKLQYQNNGDKTIEVYGDWAVGITLAAVNDNGENYMGGMHVYTAYKKEEEKDGNQPYLIYDFVPGEVREATHTFVISKYELENCEICVFINALATPENNPDTTRGLRITEYVK